jgi:hypothetical protein
MITDISLHKPPGLDKIQPINLAPTSFVMVPDDKGDSNIAKVEEYDPEPREDAYLKSIGATIISKKIQV